MVLLVIAGWAIAWRANSPSDGTTISVADLALPAQGIVVRSAAQGTPLRAGDEITAIQGVPLTPSVNAGIGARSLTADPVQYEIRRGGVPMTLRIRLTTYPLTTHLLDALPSILVCLTLLGVAGALFAARPDTSAAHAALLTSALGTAAAAGSGFFPLEAIDLVAGGQFWRWFGGEVCFLLLWPALLHFALTFAELSTRKRFRVAIRAGYVAAIGGYLVVAGWDALFAAPYLRLSLAGSPSLAPLFAILVVLAVVLYGTYRYGREGRSLNGAGLLIASLLLGAALYFGLWTLPTVAGWAPVPAQYQVLAFLPVPLVVAALLMTGDHADPYRVVAAFASRLETMRTPDLQLQAVVDTIGVALRLPYVAIELDRDIGTENAASYGTPTALSHRLALTHQGERVGELVVAQSDQRGSLGRKESAALAEVAKHAGTVVYTARLTTDLIRSRETLVRAREHERKQLLRELHDGVVPTLSAITLGLHASRTALGRTDPVEPLLAQLQEALAGAVTELRRMAHGLRPPSLESLGLLGAIREHITTCGTMNGEVNGASRPRITLDAPAELPPLPAAVDLAAYRIVCEALTNVSRHANASNCTVTISIDGPLRIEITDDGSGLPSSRDRGIGLSSMRERADELGGEFRAERLDTGGTRICAELPLPPVPAEERT